ncbi:hypothetical protein MSG28_015348 [Choristoneura fumiferana]|uniref:Uncharacterized protein n=1 Tax=Choristoneura fumiferana TaxID=7141 RepID=A0ACC0KAH9_CHOFU|nr:hypothetical protein MSG28_015348 [Choristoneura fumiferana]
MVRCSILGCKSDSEKKLPDISFHSFPENPNLHQKWIAATGRTNWTAKKSSKICSRHFEQHELIKKKKITLLLPNAVPSQIKNPAIGDDVVDVMPSTSNQDHIMEIDSAESFTTSLIQQPVNVHQPLIAPIPASTSVAGTNITTKPDATDNIVPSTTVLKHLDIEPDVELSASSVLLSVDDGPDYSPRTLKRKWKKSEEKATKRLKKLKALREKSRRLSKKVANLEKMIAELKAKSLISEEDGDLLESIDPINREFLKKFLNPAGSSRKYSPELHVRYENKLNKYTHLNAELSIPNISNDDGIVIDKDHDYLSDPSRSDTAKSCGLV